MKLLPSNPGATNLPLVYQVHYALAFSPNSAWVAFTGSRYSTRVCSPDNNTCSDITGKMPLGDPFSADSRKLAFVNVEEVKTDNPGLQNKIFTNALFLQDLTSNSAKRMGISIDDGIMGYIHQGSIALIGNNRQTRAWDMNTNLEISKQEAGELGCQVMRVVYDHTFLSATTIGRVVEEWDPRMQHICSYVVGMKNALVTLTNDLNRVAYINQYGLVEVYDPVAKQIAWKKAFNNPVSSLAFSPDGSILAVGQTGGQITFYTTKSGDPLSDPILGLSAEIKELRFSPDGKYLAALSANDSVYLYSAIDYK